MGNRWGDSAEHACIAMAGPVEKSITLEIGMTDDEQNVWKFTKAALDLLEQCVRGTA